MKKILLTIAVLAAGVLALSAQDLENATNQFNSGITAFQEGDAASALTAIEGALAEAEAIAENEAAQAIVDDCKKVLPQIINRLGKEALNAKNYEEAIARFKLAGEKATEFGTNEDLIAETASLIIKAKQAQAQSIMKTEPAKAIALLNEVVAAEPTNGVAHLLLGQLHQATGKIAEAEAEYNLATENGQGSKAVKALGTMFLKECQKLQKAGKFAEAVAAADKSYGYVPSANALKLKAASLKGAKLPAEAIAAYEQYVAEFGAKDAKINETYYAIAALAQEAGIKDKAIEYYGKITADPKLGAYATAQLQALGAK